jgi:hypothetical protein
MSNLTYLWSQGMVDKIAKKVAEEKMENRVLFEGTPFEVDEGNYTEHMPSKKKKRPQHVIDEEEADLARERQRERAQMEMFDDPWENWSGHR